MTIAANAAPILVVCGLRAEARIAAGDGVVAVLGGGDPRALAAALHAALDRGAAAVVSFGVAGALSPALRPGDLVVPERVVADDATYDVDPRWAAMLRLKLPHAIVAHCAGCDAIVADREGKRRLRDATGAAIVDMESHVAARAARAHGVPFAAIRAVTDAADRTLPPAASLAMREGGRIDLAAVLRSVARTPGQIPALIGIARDTRAALDALRRGRRLLGPRLGDPDLDQLPLDVV